jgi:hypothetical protein
MSSSDEVGERKLSRRRFVESAGMLVAVGVIGVGLGDVAAQFLKQESKKPVNYPVLRPSTTAGAWAPAARAPAPLYRTTPVAPQMTASDTFSIFWITDTQFLSESSPDLYSAQTAWIVNNWVPFNGKLVIHTGDIVEHGSFAWEWKSANEAMSTLLQFGIPYTWCAGNHDDLENGDPTSGWIGRKTAPAFDPSVVSSRVNSLGYTTWAGDYHDAMNTAVAFTASDLNFLVVTIEWNAQPDVLTWVEGLLTDPKYANHHVIIAPHAYMDETGDIDDAKWGATLAGFVNGLTPLMNRHSSNVFLTLNGHFATDCGYNTTSPINGRNQLMFDRQDSLDDPEFPLGRGVDDADMKPDVDDSKKVGGSTVTVLTFDTVRNLIRSRTYDVFTGNWRDNPYEKYTVAMFPSPASTIWHGQRLIPQTQA